jgi:hypothetical protein
LQEFTLAGFERVRRRIGLSPNDPTPKVDLQLTPEKHGESVTVNANPESGISAQRQTEDLFGAAGRP